MAWQAFGLARRSRRLERRAWIGLGLLAPGAALLLVWHALTPPELWQEAMLEAHPDALRGGAEAWPLKMLLLVHLLLPVSLGGPLLRQPDLSRPGLVVLTLPWVLWFGTMLLVWRR